MVRNTNIAMDSFRSSMLSVKDTTDAVEILIIYAKTAAGQL